MATDAAAKKAESLKIAAREKDEDAATGKWSRLADTLNTPVNTSSVGNAAAKAITTASSSSAVLLLFFLIITALHVYDAFLLDFSNSMLSLRFLTFILILPVLWLILGPGIDSSGLKAFLKSFQLPVILGILHIALAYSTHLPETPKGIIQIFVILPPWILYLIAKMNKEREQAKTAYKFGVFIMVAYLVIGITFAWIQINPSLQNVDSGAPAQARTYISSLVDTIRAGGEKFGQEIEKGGVNIIRTTVTPEFYSRVEENKDKPYLGVRLADDPTTTTLFQDNDFKTVWTIVQATAMDADKPIKEITLSCFAINDKERIEGEMIPKAIYDVRTSIEQPVSCSFSKDKLSEEGQWKIVINADFDFETFSSLTVYFMNREEELQLRRANINPLGKYGIKDKEPVAVSTGGPARIGLGTLPKFLIGLTDDQQQAAIEGQLINQFKIGATIANNWEGNITNFEKIMLFLPKQITLDAESCDYNVKQSECDDDYCKKDSEVNVYSVEEENDERGRRGLDKLPSITSIPVSMNCRAEANYQDTMQESGLAGYALNSVIKYSYRFDKAITITIQKTQAPENVS
ncbi:MAG TPA: hypothetical protein VJI75_04455 [Candidatus Nanoarchaeia archaeon]|nr:hypothetical protein [Candidatus Nanoarchaeia archaeon]